MQPATGSPSARLIRLAILDDNPFVRLPGGEVHPKAALFHRFAEAVVAAGPFEPASYLVPVRDLPPDAPSPALGPVDQRRLRVVPTAPFDGIAGYLRRGPWLLRRNWPIVREAIRGTDLVWIKAPASNALLALVAARRARRPFFTWVAGSAGAVVRGPERRGPGRVAAASAAATYDGVTKLLERSGPAIRLDPSQFTSLVTEAEVRATRDATREAPRLSGTSAEGGPVRLVWAGRIVADKGLDDLLEATARLRASGLPTELEIIGDGPDRARLEASTPNLALDGAVRWTGYVGDRGSYLERLREADLFVLPSRAEGVPKVLVEAMAAGLPIVATRVGAVASVLDDGRLGRLVPPADADRLAVVIGELARDPTERARLRAAGLDFAAAHTIDAQAQRLVDWLRATFPNLPWLARGEGLE